MKKILLFSLIAFTFIVSCTKISTTEIGTGLIPPIDGIITKDTINCALPDTASFMKQRKSDQIPIKVFGIFLQVF